MNMSLEVHNYQNLAFLNTVPQNYQCLEALFECASACWISADACLNDANRSHLQNCIIKGLECAEVCSSTARALILQQELNKEELSLHLKRCITACQSFITECEMLAMDHEHCHICLKCSQQCVNLCEAELMKLMA